ncbi:MAG: histidine kinase [Sphaerochaeta sp.]|nr:histidine kinase [Sphaerochaeta sp.]
MIPILGGIDTLIILEMFSLLKERDLLIQYEIQEKLENFLEKKYNQYYEILIQTHCSNFIGTSMEVLQNNPDEFFSQGLDFQLMKFVDTMSFSDRDVLDFFILPLGSHPYHGSFRSNRHLRPLYPFNIDAQYAAAMRQDQFLYLFSDNTSRYSIGEPENVITLIGKMYAPSQLFNKKVVGHLVINIPEERLGRELGMGLISGKGEYAVVNTEGRVLFSTDHELDRLAQETILSGREHEKIIENKAWYIQYSKIKDAPLYVVNMISRKQMWAPLNSLLVKMFLLVVLGLLLASLMTFFSLRVSTRRVYTLLEAFGEVQKGNLDIRLPVGNHDEIGQLQEKFNRMCEDLSAYIDRVYTAEIQKKEMENIFLQSQINPHFLYNTLDQIRSRALVHGDGELARMITLLAELFRWSIKSPDPIVRLEDELEHVYGYLEIQKLRLRERLELDFSIDESLLDYAIPRMILQPLVENALTHGLPLGEEQGRITIRIEKDADTIVISIEDNGPGVNSELYPEILLRKATSGHIGIANVNQRLCLLFGESHKLRFLDQKTGFCVQVIIPAMRVKEMSVYVQSAYSR